MIEKVNSNVIALIALLYDVDDYKLFGVESANNLTNAKNILDQCSIEYDIKEENEPECIQYLDNFINEMD